MSTAWALLLGAAALEVVWALLLKESDGFSRPLPTAAGVTAAVASVVLLTAALRHLPVGTAYAVWTGLGSVGVALAGMVLLGESTSAARIACLALVFAGVAGLRLVE